MRGGNSLWRRKRKEKRLETAPIFQVTHKYAHTDPKRLGRPGQDGVVAAGQATAPSQGGARALATFHLPSSFLHPLFSPPPKDAPKETQTPPRVSDMRMRVQAHFQISSLAHPARRCHLYSELAPQPRNPPASTHTTEIRARQLNLSPPCRGTGWRGGCGTGAPHLGLGKEKKREKEETERRQRG